MWHLPLNGADGRFLNRHHSILGPARLRHFDMGPSPIDFGYRGRGGPDIINQQIIYEAPRRSWLGNIADLFMGISEGYMAYNYTKQMSQQMMYPGYDPYSMSQYAMYPQYQVYQQYPAQQDSQTSSKVTVDEFKNLQTIGKTTGYSQIVSDPYEKGVYTVINPETKDYITGTYDEIMEKTLPRKDAPGKVDKPDNKTDTKPVQDNENEEVDPENGTEDEPEVKPQGAHSDKTVVKAKELANYKGQITVTDDVLGKKADVTGETTYSDDKTNGYPNIMTIGDYNYELQTPVKADKVMYTSLDGDGQSYRLEWRDGKVVLIQHEGDDGAGDTDIHYS